MRWVQATSTVCRGNLHDHGASANISLTFLLCAFLSGAIAPGRTPALRRVALTCAKSRATRRGATEALSASLGATGAAAAAPPAPVAAVADGDDEPDALPGAAAEGSEARSAPFPWPVLIMGAKTDRLPRQPCCRVKGAEWHAAAAAPAELCCKLMGWRAGFCARGKGSGPAPKRGPHKPMALLSCAILQAHNCCCAMRKQEQPPRLV